MFNEQHPNKNINFKYVLELISTFRQIGSLVNENYIKNKVKNEVVEVDQLGQVAVNPTLSTQKR